MKTYQPILTTSITAGADIPKGRFIGFDGGLCGANAKALGVSEVDTKQGQQLPVIVYGIAIVETGGAVSAGAAVTSDSSGRAVAASNVSVTVTVPAGETPVTSTAAQPDLQESISGGVLPQAINGYALDSATQAGQFIRVKLV